jgi:hypothetical protein
MALNRLISQDNDPERLLRLLADELPNFNDVNVATAFSKLGKLCGKKRFSSNITADDRFRGLMVLASDMCDDGRLQAQAVANIVHAMSKLSAAGKLATDDAGVQDTLAALERRVALVTSDMNPQNVSNAAYGFALLGRMPAAQARAALEVAVVQVALDPDMKPQEVAAVMWAFAMLGWELGAEAQAALEAAVLRVGPLMNAQEAANAKWSYATLGLMPGAEAWTALDAVTARGFGKGPSAAYALNKLISQEDDAQGLLCLVADELPNFDEVNVATVFSKLGKLCGSRSFPRNLAADDSFRGLMVSARDLCANGRLQSRNLANIIHAVSKMSKAGKLATDDAGVQATLMALEQRVVLVASGMEPQHVSNTAYGFALLGRMPGAEARAALEAAVVRVAPDMTHQAVANTAWSFATLKLMPGAEAWAALETAVVRVGPGMNAQAVANIAWSFATLGLMPGTDTWAALELAVAREGPGMTAEAVTNIEWSYATLGRTPGAEARAALEVALVRVGPYY